jgi:hypothetical protein
MVMLDEAVTDQAEAIEAVAVEAVADIFNKLLA